METKKFIVHCDMGSVKIRFGNGAAFLANGVGDGTFTVSIMDKIPTYETPAGYFEIYSGTGELMDYDCPSEKAEVLYTFGPGRYWAEHDRRGNIYIERWELL